MGKVYIKETGDDDNEAHKKGGAALAHHSF